MCIFLLYPIALGKFSRLEHLTCLLLDTRLRGETPFFLNRQSFQRRENDKLERELANYGPWVKSSLLPVFVNKVLLEHSHLCVFSILQLLLCHNSKVAGLP